MEARAPMLVKYLGDNMWVDADAHAGHTYVWNGAKTVNVYAGGRGARNTDTITFMEQPTRAQVEAAINRRRRGE